MILPKSFRYSPPALTSTTFSGTATQVPFSMSHFNFNISKSLPTTFTTNATTNATTTSTNATTSTTASNNAANAPTDPLPLGASKLDPFHGALPNSGTSASMMLPAGVSLSEAGVRNILDKYEGVENPQSRGTNEDGNSHPDVHLEARDGKKWEQQLGKVTPASTAGRKSRDGFSDCEGAFDGTGRNSKEGGEETGQTRREDETSKAEDTGDAQESSALTTEEIKRAGNGVVGKSTGKVADVGKDVAETAAGKTVDEKGVDVKDVDEKGVDEKGADEKGVAENITAKIDAEENVDQKDVVEKDTTQTILSKTDVVQNSGKTDRAAETKMTSGAESSHSVSEDLRQDDSRQHDQSNQPDLLASSPTDPPMPAASGTLQELQLHSGPSNTREDPPFSAMSIQAYEPDLEAKEIAFLADHNDSPEAEQDYLEKLAESKMDSENADRFEKNDILSIEASEPLEEFQVPDVKPLRSEAADASHKAPKTTRASSRKDSLTSKIDAKEQHQVSHRPFDFSVFLSHLRNKNADPIVRYIRSFLVSFTRRADSLTTAQKTKAVRNFTDFLAEKFSLHEPFALMDATDTENSLEGVEKLIMNRLYECCFPVENDTKAPSGALEKDLDEDRELALQMEKFSWLSGTHLDVDVGRLSRGSDVDYLQYAETELNKINTYRAPRDKIICILNACKIIFSLLRVNGHETNADLFIPLLILVMLRAKPPRLISNLHYIERYRGERWLIHGETSYYLSTVQGAILFIQNIQKDDLTVSDKEYDAHMEAWEAAMRQKNALRGETTPADGSSDSAPTEVPAGRTLSPSGVILASAEMLTKSISSFISPAAEESTQPLEPEPNPDALGPGFDTVFAQLAEMFPNLDKAVMRDIIVMNHADLESSLDMCLQLAE